MYGAKYQVSAHAPDFPASGPLHAATYPVVAHVLVEKVP